jgi:hypothetical protein
MNTEEVCEMIDAITEGRTFARTWQGAVSNIHLAVGEEGFAIHANEFGCNDPRTAREIAGALVAWASRMDPQNEKPLYGIPGDDVPGNCVTPRVWHNSTIHRRHHKVHGNCPADIPGDD